ncbi:MAG: hypothetical protein A2Y33_09780 [Spirochaetes bacterium GWF1_51_8]|nr:MAG: hypothetical protein A2Y33_09780 [Spirochaetes bacterium GWF1_51_8]
MAKVKIDLSPLGERLLEEAKKKSIAEIASYQRLRTKFFYPVSGGENIDFVELRQIIDNLVSEFNLRFSSEHRDTGYMSFLNNKAFDVFNMRIHRLSPDNYLVVTQKKSGHPVFIIHDKQIDPKDNILIRWDDESFSEGTVESIPFHIPREMLELE